MHANSHLYQEKWGLPKVKAAPPPASPARESPPCVREGAVLEFCTACPASAEAKHVRDCDLHGKCTRASLGGPVRGCDRCPDYASTEPAPPPHTRHLLYHVYPRKGSAWRSAVRKVMGAAGLFNGRRVVAAAFDDTTEHPDVVAAEFGVGYEVVSVPNNPERREVETFPHLFGRVCDLAGPGHATLWAHAKGVTRPGGFPHRAAAVMADAALDYWPLVSDLLGKYPVAGSFLKVGNGWAGTASDWHYSGSWFWFRNDALFTRDWRRIDPFWSGIESYPSLHFRREEAGVIFYRGTVPELDLYGPESWEKVEPAWTDWKAANARRRTGAAATPAAEGLRVELGGGKNPRPGFVNVDKCEGADHHVDFEGLRRADADDRRDVLPFADDSVDEVYSAHCFEHVGNLHGLLHEIVRVCKVGARVEVRVPHYLSPMAVCHDHKQVIPPEQVDHWCRSATGYWWEGCTKRLRHLHTEAVPGGGYGEAARAFPGLTHDQLLKFVPGAAHELRYFFDVIVHAD